MSVKALQEFYEAEVKDAKDTELLMSLHLKATMMKVSDPIMVRCCSAEVATYMQRLTDNILNLSCVYILFFK